MMPLPRSCADQLRRLHYLPSARITRRVVGEEGRATTAVIGPLQANGSGTHRHLRSVIQRPMNVGRPIVRSTNFAETAETAPCRVCNG